jgi:hypothetical protein
MSSFSSTTTSFNTIQCCLLAMMDPLDPSGCGKHLSWIDECGLQRNVAHLPSYVRASQVLNILNGAALASAIEKGLWHKSNLVKIHLSSQG